MNKMIENEMNSMEFQEEEAPLFDFKQLWMLFVLNWRWFIASVVACVMIAFVYLWFRPNPVIVSSNMQILGESKQGGGSAAAAKALNALPVNLGSSVSTGSEGIETVKRMLTSTTLIRDVVKNLGLYAEYSVDSWGRHYVLYKTQPIVVTLDPSHLKWFDDEMLTAYHHIDLTIHKTGDVYHITTIADGAELPEQNFKSLPATVKTDIGNLTIAANPQLNAQQAAAYAGDFKINVSVVPPKAMAARLAGAMAVDPPFKNVSDVVTISIQEDNYLRGIEFINALVDRYNERINEQKDEEVRKSEEFVNERLAKLDIELGSSDADWQHYKEDKKIIDAESEAEMVMTKKETAEMTLLDIDVQLALHDYQAEYINDPANLFKIYPGGSASGSSSGGSSSGGSSSGGSSSGGSSSGGSSSGGSSISRHNSLVLERDDLLKSMSEKAPQILRLNEKIKELQPTIQLELNRNRQQMLIQRKPIEREYNKAVNRFSQAPKMEREMTDIERQREIKQGVYLSMLQKREEVAADLARSMKRGRLIDDPIIGGVPQTKQEFVLLGAFLLGLIIPMGILFLFQMLKSKIDTKQELEEISKLPILSEVFLTNNDDAIRTLRTNLLFNLKDGQKVIMLASHDKGDGKTYLAQRLVDSLTQIGKKAQYLNLNLREDRSKAAQAADLLAGADVAKQIESLKAANDYLVLDTPEMAKYADIYQIAQFADATIFVVKAESTEKYAVKEITKNARIPNPMLVLNAIDMSKKKYQYLYK